MGRILMVTCAFGLWAGPVFAQELELAPPKLSTRSGECTLQQRATCGDTHQRALRSDLSCDLCAAAPLPPDIIAPAGAGSGRAGSGRGAAGPGRGKVADECAPRSGPVPSSCVERPRLDTLPKL